MRVYKKQKHYPVFKLFAKYTKNTLIRLWYTILNVSVQTGFRGSSTSAKCHSIAKRLRTVKVLYVISNKIISCTFLCQKAKQSYITLHNNVIKYLKTYSEINCPKTGMKYHQLLNDDAPAHEASILTEYPEA